MSALNNNPQQNQTPSDLFPSRIIALGVRLELIAAELKLGTIQSPSVLAIALRAINQVAMTMDSIIEEWSEVKK